MGICCSTHSTPDDLMDEIRRDAKISEYETKDNDDLLKSLTSPKLSEKIVFEVKDNVLENYSKDVFQQLNEIRTNPISFSQESKKEGTYKILRKLIESEKRPTLFSWSTKKSRSISDYFTNEKNVNKPSMQKLKEIKDRYESDFYISIYEAKGVITNPNKVIWNLFNKLQQKEIYKILFDTYAYCVIYSECSKNNVNEIASYFFFFKLLDY